MHCHTATKTTILGQCIGVCHIYRFGACVAMATVLLYKHNVSVVI